MLERLILQGLLLVLFLATSAFLAAAEAAAPHKRALWAARPVLALAWLLAPVRALLGAFPPWVSRWASRNAPPPASISEAELRTLVEVGHREGVVQRTEREMIHGVFELGETTVGDIMTPRTDIFGVEAGTAPERVPPEIRSRVPLC